MTPSTTLRALIVAFIAIAPVASTVADQTQTSPSVNPTKSRAPGDQPKPKKSKNGTSDISNQQALNMQEFNDRRTQAYESLSNIEKKEAKTGDAIVANVKTGKPTPKPKSNPMPKKTPKP